MSLLEQFHNLPTLSELKGAAGEQLTKYYAKVMTDALVLHDVLIDGAEGRTSQIDLLLISTTGIYVVEVKNFANARIYGDGKKSTWYYYLGKKRYEIYSPLLQNKKHITYLKEFLHDFGEIPCFSVLILLCENFKVETLGNEPDNPTTVVCNSLPAMSLGLKRLSEGKPTVFTPEDKRRIYDYILKHERTGIEARVKHKENLRQMQDQRQRLVQQNLCPYCKVELVLQKGKYGEFYVCVNDPNGE